MAEIYHAAEVVVVWLGLSNPSDTLAFATTQAMERRTLGLGDNESRVRRWLRAKMCCSRCKQAYSAAEATLEQGLKALIDLNRREWFNRLWVIQEVTVTREVELACGLHRCDWITFQLAYAAPKLNLLKILKEQSQQNFSANALLRQLMTCLEWRCRDPRGRIFAVRSITGLDHLDNMQPDYNLPAEEIYRRVVVACLATPGSIVQDVVFVNWWQGLPHTALILALVGLDIAANISTVLVAPRRGSHIVASWVPNFGCLDSVRARRKAHEYSRYLGPKYLQKDPPNIDRLPLFVVQERAARICFTSNDSDVMHVGGKKLGSIIAVLPNSRCPWASEENTNMRGTFHPWYHHHCVAFIRRYWEHAMHRQEIKALPNCFSSDTYINDPDLWYSVDYAEDGIHSKYCHHDIDSLSTEERAKELEVAWTVMDIKHRSYYDHGRVLAAIQEEDGRTLLGWVPETTRDRDIVCAFAGFPRPFLLRPHEEGHYTLLEIHGFTVCSRKI